MRKKRYIRNEDRLLVFFLCFAVFASYSGNAEQCFSLLFLPPLFLQSFQLLQELQLRARVIGLIVAPIILIRQHTPQQHISIQKDTKFEAVVHTSLVNMK